MAACRFMGALQEQASRAAFKLLAKKATELFIALDDGTAGKAAALQLLKFCLPWAAAAQAGSCDNQMQR